MVQCCHCQAVDSLVPHGRSKRFLCLECGTILSVQESAAARLILEIQRLKPPSFRDEIIEKGGA